ncbi:response regulator transcription factor [Paenibacillus sp. HB172176]|uniref:response regulator transcription factor n=1 Tax=Paenibacillus sp. HB172176 TaxID=2493690 RepID=UPI00143AF060|nr:response regulator transcription factor [Paenibacillus sp. HB172176]
MNNVLLVDDDSSIRELMELYLMAEGFQTVHAKDGQEASELLEKQRFQLAIVDVMMPQKDGWQLCMEIRQDYDLPILMVTAKGETDDKMKGFELGTDDYLVKPFDPRELVMRVKAILRRYKVNAHGKISIGNLSMDLNMWEAVWDGDRLSFPTKEFLLLFKLASSPGQVFSRDQLLEDIWGIDFEGSDRTIDSHIKKIRKKFEGKPAPFEIISIRGLGYRLEENKLC